jgi:hypothetical protein
MAGKDKLEFDVLANDKASRVFDRVANAGKAVGKQVESGADKGSRALKTLGESAKKAEDTLGKMGDGAKKGMGKLTDAFKAGPLAWIGIGAGIGGLVMEGFGQALENEDANHLLAAQLGASNADMERLGKISGDLYKDAFGESVSEINQVMKTVFQSGLAATSDAEDKIKGVTTQVMNYSKITGEEALPVTRAVSQLLKTGLAKNATEAFDLLTRGVQKGLDKSEDLLDTVNEYGTQFRKLGLDGTQAFGLISQAIQAGARDSDIAADAIKEFSIRAVDGSAQTAAGFEGLGLSAKQMSETIAQGGPKAAAALGLTLDKLRGIKDPAKQAQLAVMLFGTQAEDLGAALYAMNLDTATKQFGAVGGAAQRAGDLINDTTSNKLTTLGRTIKMSIVDAIGKYALPQLAKFADWFNGPGKMVMVGWALTGAQAIVSFADKTLGALQSMIPALAKVGSAMYYAAAAAAYMGGQGAEGMKLFAQGKAMEAWAIGTQESLGKSRKALQDWNAELGKAKTKVQLTADIEDLDQKLAKAQAELRDPGLTKERRAVLTANIAQLNRARDEALRKLGDKNLIKTRTARLEADKRNLDSKIANAKKQLADPKLTATRRATLEANIAQLLRQKANAQAAINSLTGKTVTVNIVQKYTTKGVNVTSPSSVGRREGGGPVTKGQAYVVGEKRAELFIPEENGRIIPEVPRGARPQPGTLYSGAPAVGGGGAAVLHFNDSETSRFIVRMLRQGLQGGGAQGDVQFLIGGRPA